MLNKNTKKVRILSMILAIILLFSCISSLFIYKPIIKAQAWSIDDIDFTGTEDAENESDFSSLTNQNIYKIYSVLRAYGLSCEQACGALGCFYHESAQTFCSEVIEAQYTSLISPEYNTDTRDTYIEDYCTRFEKEHETDFWQYVKKHTKGISEKGYRGDPSTPNDHYPGIGMAQFTGSRSKNLLNWSIENCDGGWWIMENQLTWMFLPPDDGGDTSSPVFADYRDATATSKDVENCCWVFAYKYEHGGFRNPTGKMVGWLAARKQSAKKIYAQLKNVNGYDAAYGEKILACAGITAAKVKTGIQDRGIIESVAEKSLYYPMNTGDIIPSEKSRSDRYKKNKDVYSGLVKELQGDEDDSTEYCLYELYGGNIHWYRYFGETTHAPTLMDHVYSGIVQDKVDDLKKFDTIVYTPNNYLSCRVYEGRPTVLSTPQVLLGYNDPRVLYLYGSVFLGYDYVVGSMELAVAKFAVAFVSFLIGDSLIAGVGNALSKLESNQYWPNIVPIFYVILGLVMVLFIFSLVGKAIKYSKGTGSAREFISRFAVGIISIGLLFVMLAKPAVFNDTIIKTMSTINSFFVSGFGNPELTKDKDGKDINKIADDEIIKVSKPELAVEAALWKTCVFNAWCRGQFNGRNYNTLYTQYADVEDKYKMPQSHDEVDKNDVTGQAFYNSAECTGDVYVSIGGGTKIRNWAAYLYSCGSKYHIDTSMDDASDVKDIDLSEPVVFPNANTTAYDSNIMADTYRVIDAQMNIAPKKFADGSISENYSKAHPMLTWFTLQGLVALVNAVLLLLLIPPAWGRLKDFIMMLVTSIKIIYYTIMEIAKEGTGFSEFMESFKKAFFGYIANTVKLYMLIYLYTAFVDKGFGKMIIYIILALTVLAFNFKDAKQAVTDAKNTVTRIKNAF